MPIPICAGVLGIARAIVAWIETLAQHRERRARDDRHDELIRPQLAAELAQHRRQDLQLHRQDDDVRALRRLGVRRERLHAELFGQLRTPFAARAGDEDV